MDLNMGQFEESMLPRGSRASEYWGAKDVNSMFPEGGQVTPTPWSRAGRRKDRQDYDPDLVRQAISSPTNENVRDIDPRLLQSTKPNVTRGGVQHYLENEDWAQTGQTFADQSNPGNRIPVVYSRRNEYRQADWQPEYEHMLLSGHHRASGALLQGKQFPARHVIGGFGPER